MGTETENKILEKLDEMKEQRYENGLAAKELDGRVVATETYIGDHKDWHKDDAKHRRSLNWKMWFALIGGAIGLIFVLLKDQVI